MNVTDVLRDLERMEREFAREPLPSGVVVSEHVPPTERPVPVYHRSLLARLCHGRTVDVGQVPVYDMVYQVGGKILVHPTTWAAVRAGDLPRSLGG